jgi:multidrug efflux pump subunit AcrB
MDLIKASLRKPVSVMVIILAIGVFSYISVTNMPIDIFPKLGIPTIYVAQPYGGLSPEQMEGYMTSVYEQHFIYITGVSYMESRSVQSMALIKLEFYEDTDMAEALAQVVAQVNRAGGKMPPGTTAPFVIRYDAGNIPVGLLVFSSETRSLPEIQNLAVQRIRPMFSGLRGVSSPPPVGGNQRSVIVSVDPDKLRGYGFSTEDVVEAIASNNRLSPAGSIRIDDLELLTSSNAVVPDIQELINIPVRSGSGPAVYIGDLATVHHGADITVGYALVNGERSVYIPITKRTDASTWTVTQSIKRALPSMSEAIPEDIKVEYAFDQSEYVISSLSNVLIAGLFASLLTGMIVLVFLGNIRSGLIVVLTIPLALLSSLIFLYLAGQTLNIMTLLGLALAIGVLVDHATVTIENIHRHFEKGKSLPLAISDGAKEMVIPMLLIVLSILAVFVPSFFMSGVPKAMFVPLSLAVGFAMIASFLLAQSFVPVMANWLIKEDTLKKHIDRQKEGGKFQRYSDKYLSQLSRNLDSRKIIIPLYLVITLGISVLAFLIVGTEIFPRVDAGQFQMRLVGPEGTRIEVTEQKTRQVLEYLNKIVGRENVEVTSGYVGMVPSAYPASTTYIMNSGPHVANMLVKLKGGSGISIERVKEQIRGMLREDMPEMKISFEPADIVDRVMSMGASTPIEIAVTGRDINETRRFGEKIRVNLEKLPYLRDVHILQPLDYPTVKVDINRTRIGQLGLNTDQVNKSLLSATSSSRFTRPVYWLETVSGNSYQVQVEVPQYRMASLEDMRNIYMPQVAGFNSRLRDFAEIDIGPTQGEILRLNQQRMVVITANLHEKSLGASRKDVERAISEAGERPRGLNVIVRGQLEFLKETTRELQGGLVIAIIVILLMLSVNFQSFKVAIATLSTLPAVVTGALLFLLITGSTLNIQSYMGIIMAVGVSIANAILFVTFAEDSRRINGDSVESSRMAGKSRLRPILMTSISMIVGLIPLALGGDQTAPLGIAVIGGLTFSLISILFFMPAVYASLMKNAGHESISLDPYDKKSLKYEEYK